MQPADLILPGLAAMILPGLGGWLLARRNGPLGLGMALAFCAAMALAGWYLVGGRGGRAAGAQDALAIFFVVVPALVSLVIGAVAGWWSHLNRR